MKAVLLGYYGAGNLGDEMMLYCLHPWLKRQGIEITVLSEFPENVRKTHGLPAVLNLPLLGQWSVVPAWARGGAWRVVRTIREHDALIVGGGDLIRDDLGWKQFSYTIEKMLVALLLGKRVYILNGGIGQMQTSYGRAILGWVLRRCRHNIVRDRRSVDVSLELGAAGHTTLAPDIVLTLPAMNQELDQETENYDGAPYAVVCLRLLRNSVPLYHLTEQRRKNLAAALDTLIHQTGWDIRFLPFQSNSVEHLCDNDLHEQVAAAMQQRNRAQVLPWTDELSAVSRTMRGARLVVTMRLHAAVLATALQRPVAMMPCERKVREFAELSHNPHLIEAEMLDDPALVSQLLERARQEIAQERAVPSEIARAGAVWREMQLDGV